MPKLFKKPFLTKIEHCQLDDGGCGEIHYIPKLKMSINLQPLNENTPIRIIAKDDGSFDFFVTPNSVTASIKTENGFIILSERGLETFEEANGKLNLLNFISWRNSKPFVGEIQRLVLKDMVFQASIVGIPSGLRIALNTCGVLREAIDIVNDLPQILNCTTEFIPEVTRIVDKTAECMSRKADILRNCKRRCNNKPSYKRPFCKAGCYAEYGIGIIECAALGIVEVVVQAARTIEHCVLKRGIVTGPPQAGDIIVFEVDSAIGEAINLATCGYGYSHIGFVCNSTNNKLKVWEAIENGIVDNFTDPTNIVRGHKIVRLGLSNDEIKAMCKCLASKKGQNYDLLEAITFGTINQPGKETCTMLVMNCLDNIGFNRDSIGLDGFVSPNDIARIFDLPPVIVS